MNLVKYKSRRATRPCDMYMVTFSAGVLLTDTDGEHKRSL